jgi:hypothetical protein
MASSSRKRQYIYFDQSKGYPVGGDLYYECISCGESYPSRPLDNKYCSCGNLGIDIEAGRISVQNDFNVRLYKLA